MKRFLPILLLVATPALASDITRESVVAAMNDYRAQHHMQPLREDARLDAAAGDRMTDMEDQGYWAHESPDGRSPFVWLASRDYELHYAGENLATGFETTELLVAGWMESPGHRANILSPHFEDCGIAIIDGLTMRRGAGKSIVVMFGATR
ncbi:MAG: CAP domain-containing protein [Acidobacteriota bacterium]|nr:CAP domain-containing protein [Acidobacteriota bacterium]